DVKALAVPVMRHRLVLSTEAELSDRSPVDVVRDLLDSVAPPSSVTDDSSENGDTIDTDVGTAKLSNID
ncbi:hypothetical protein SAMN05444342_3461, partial [Haladaptatus paucihalophilus DX253]